METMVETKCKCKNTTKILARCVVLVEKAKTEGLNKQEYLELISYLWVVNHNDNKLEGLKSLSSCCLDNPFCIARMLDPDCICSHCYAGAQQSYQAGLADHNVINGYILSNVEIPVGIWRIAFSLKVFDCSFFRIESFGDVKNYIHALNYHHFISAFPSVTFAVWTKNVTLWEKVLNDHGKPANMVYIVSACELNTVPEKVSGYADHVFTVYTKEYIESYNVVINCRKKCAECIKDKANCYFHGTEFYINEKKK